MHLASLNPDVLFHLIKFVDPVDRFNLVLSGVLKGFENVGKVINVEYRITNFQVFLGPCRDRMGQLEIRFLTIFDQYDEALHSKSCEILKILVEEGLLKNNRGFSLTCYPWSRIPPFLENICSMTKLVDLNLLRCDVPLEQLSTFFGSCPKLVELCVDLDLDGQELEMDDCLKNELERGFQKLKILTLSVEIDMDSWPVIKEIIIWLRECVELRVFNTDDFMNPICGTDRSLTLNPTLAQNLQKLTLDDTPVDFIRMILPSCLHINTLNLGTNYEGMGAVVDIDRLKKLKKLCIDGRKASDFQEILRNCHQVEILHFTIMEANLEDITEWAAENVKEVKLGWDKGPSIEQVLPVLAKWRHLRKLTFLLDERHYPSSEVLCDFIMGMKHLRYLNLLSGSNPQVKPLIDKINEFVLPRRPNFELE